MLASRFSALLMLMLPSYVLAADSPVGDGLGRMVVGMIIVLLVIAGLAWVARKVLPYQGKLQSDMIRQVGGLALGPRERIVVLEIADRWLVVGLNGQQMTALGDVPAQTSMTPEGVELTVSAQEHSTGVDPQAPFAKRLQQAMQHTLRKSIKS